MLGSMSPGYGDDGLGARSDGRWRVRLVLGDRYAELVGRRDDAMDAVFTGGPNRDWSIAVEPMTCGPDAFNVGPPTMA